MLLAHCLSRTHGEFHIRGNHVACGVKLASPADAIFPVERVAAGIPFLNASPLYAPFQILRRMAYLLLLVQEYMYPVR